MVSSSMLFFNLDRFERQFRNAAVYIILKFLLYNMVCLRLNVILRVIRAVCSRKISKVLDSKLYCYHVGAFMIDRAYKEQPAVVVNFHKMYMDNIKKMKSKAKHGYWGSCRKSNQSSLRLLKAGGMKSLVEIDGFPESIFVAVSEGD